MRSFHLAQLNVARLHQPLDHADTAEFVDALDPVNALAESSPGFVWRLKDEAGQSSSYVRLPGEDDPLLIVNYSIWEHPDALRQFVFRSGHVDYLRRRREWFEKPAVPSTVLWWTPAGTIPTLDEASERLRALRADGPTAEAFTLSSSFPAPG